MIRNLRIASNWGKFLTSCAAGGKCNHMRGASVLMFMKSTQHFYRWQLMQLVAKYEISVECILNWLCSKMRSQVFMTVATDTCPRMWSRIVWEATDFSREILWWIVAVSCSETSTHVCLLAQRRILRVCNLVTTCLTN